MKKITLNIHSFIDIITNSSTEIYVQASEHTIKNIKNMVIETKTLIDSKEAELVAKIIDNLYNLFEGEERCTG